MKLRFKHQKFQADAAKAVVDVFAGQPYLTPTYMMDRGDGNYQIGLEDDTDFTGWRNERIVPELSDKLILEHLQKVQRTNQIKPSDKLEGRYNLTIEMETGVGKTYTYIKTMYELNKHYGWSKFIVVVPSIAIREGVYKSFQVTQEHFAEEYGKKIRFFIYNSAQLTEIDRFASDSAINVMIINSQAFNAKGKDARRIYMKLDEFRSRRPIDIIAKTNPILIIDEPQSVEGKQTKERLKEFCPLLTLRYSATHKADSIYIIHPRVLLCLGKDTFRCTLRALGLQRLPVIRNYNRFIESSENSVQIHLGDDETTFVFALAHCGVMGTLNRNRGTSEKASLNKQIQDWSKITPFLCEI